MIPQNIKWGWLHEQEDRETLLNTASPTSNILAMRGEFDDQDHYILADVLEANLRVENQANQGSCRGQSGSAAAETCNIIASGDRSQQFSAQYIYIETQKLDGIRGDNGATIQNGITVMERGVCPEELWPYPNPVHYQTSPPDHSIEECRAEAAKFRIRKHYDLRDYEAARTFLASNQGPIDTGIVWTESMADNNGETIEEYSGRKIGGHATLMARLSRRKDRSGRPYIGLLNSWSIRWGKRGWKDVSPTAWNQFSRDRNNVLIGVSDMEIPKPRPWDFVKRPVTH